VTDARPRNGLARFRAWVAADPLRRTMVTSVGIHVIAIIVFSISIPASPRPIDTPVYYVALMDAPEPAKQVQTPVPTEDMPPKKVESEVKIKPEKKREEQEKPEESPPKVEKKVEKPKPKPTVKPEQQFEETDEDVAIRTDQPSFEFDYYLAAVRRKISSKWRPPAGLGGQQDKYVVVHFKIRRDGSVLGPQIETSSGLDALDRSAQRAVVDALPLPPLPPAYDGPWLGIHLRFVRHD